MHIAILLTGEGTDYIAGRYGTYAEMFERLLAEPGVHFETFDVRDGRTFPEPDDFDGVVITGSAADAHATDAWILALNDSVRAFFEKRKKVLGVCFGHQVVANALGGKTGRNHAGWELGVHCLNLTSAFHEWPLADGVDELKILEIHQDHVLETPAGAVLLASSESTPVQMFTVGDHVLSIQGHPEFNNDMVRDLVETRRANGVLAADTAADGLARLELEPSADILQTLLKRFLFHR